LPDNYFITASCSIRDNRVYQNGRLVFENNPAETGGFLLAAYRSLGTDYPKFHKMDNLSKLGWLGAEFLLGGRSLVENYPAGEVGVILSNASSSLDTDMKYYATTKTMASPALFVYTLPNIVTGEICIRHRLKGENAFFISEGFEPEFMHRYVAQLLNDNILQAAICGWVELLGEQYKTVLFLIEKTPAANARPFNSDQINKTHQSENG